MFEKNTKIFFQNWPAKIEGKRGRKTHKNIHSFPSPLVFPVFILIPSKYINSLIFETSLAYFCFIYLVLVRPLLCFLVCF
ncbi:unnamed protein product [Meloidogyne enterolobii]|uniref:Uncharacterized protein n=1 Tax=Meloidogyne enterolobii TaxID=390850 RepID=A0ACB0ZR21_MELEN